MISSHIMKYGREMSLHGNHKMTSKCAQIVTKHGGVLEQRAGIDEEQQQHQRRQHQRHQHTDEARTCALHRLQL